MLLPTLNKYRNYIILALIGSLSLCGCQTKDTGADLLLSKARQEYANRDYSSAKKSLDSLNRHYPKAIAQRKASIALLDSVRRGENKQTIEVCDSLIAKKTPLLEEMKKLFVFRKNAKYQEEGEYIPRESASEILAVTTLRSGVSEKGVHFLESVFVGGGARHNKLTVYAKDGTKVESKAVNDDGFNFTFSNLGKTFEIIRISGETDNGLTEFIAANAQQALSLTLSGKGSTNSYSLGTVVKQAIVKSHNLAKAMQLIDSLKTEKEKAEFKLYQLDKKGGETTEKQQPKKSV